MQEHNTFWDYVNGGKLNARHVRKARQLEVEHLDKMGVFERAPCKVARCNTGADRAHPGSMGGHIEEQRHPQELVGGIRVSQRIQKNEGFANFSATPPLDFVKMMISMVATALKGEVSRYGEQLVARCKEMAMIHTYIRRACTCTLQTKDGCESTRSMED